MDIKLNEGERIDDLERNGYKIIQHKDKFCFGMDAVLLSGFATVKEGERVLDMGTGTGIIPILLAAKTDGRDFVGLEIQEESALMAERRDIKEASKIFGGATFDVVTCNPPYMTENHGIKNFEEPKAIARHEIKCTLEDVIREASKVLKPGGRFYMVHRPRRLVEIIELMSKYKIQPKGLRMVHPFADRKANMLLIEGHRGRKAMMKVEAPLVVYREKGIYTDEILKIYGKK